MIRSRSHCNTMGTASTMALVAEALGTTVPGVAGPRRRTAVCWRLSATPEAGRALIVEDQWPSIFLTKASGWRVVPDTPALGSVTRSPPAAHPNQAR
ncbi:dihydroxy-acid dehydratase [Actinophytocola sp.]|uniref:dihydroxy-acid dehydratase domain-containing protein n=1 Tax=Actinophytocola sp. TaxID=1872138 RepID=UPI00389A04FF